jgi:hypothetical protein
LAVFIVCEENAVAVFARYRRQPVQRIIAVVLDIAVSVRFGLDVSRVVVGFLRYVAERVYLCGLVEKLNRL